MIEHPISDALTGDEARSALAAMLNAIDAHDEHRDAQRLHAGLLFGVRLAERLAAAADGCTGAPAVAIAMQRVAA